MVHCLLIELPAQVGEACGKLALVDTGLGALDMRWPLKRLGWGMALFGGASTGTTALEHVKRIGAAMTPARSATDVAHIIMTHLDKDHTGGLADFPQATVHVHSAALAALQRVLSGRAPYVERERICPAHFAHGPQWQVFEATSPAAGTARNAADDGALSFEGWLRGHGAVTLQGLPEEIFAVPLPGHAPGHCGVAIRTASGWLLHCADSVYHRAWLDSARPPLAIQAVESLLQHDARSRRATRSMLAQLARRADVTIVSSHDPLAFEESVAAPM